ncbi:hypothetical protein D3C86_1310860 [compost metagenome]
MNVSDAMPNSEAIDPTVENSHFTSTPAVTLMPVSGSVAEPSRLTLDSLRCTLLEDSFHWLGIPRVLSESPGVSSLTSVKSPVSGETKPTAPGLILGARVQFPQ